MIINGKVKKIINKYIIGINLFCIEIFATYSATFNGISLSSGLAYIIKIPHILKIRWLNAATKAVTLSVKEASNAVTVVPIFAPIVNGYICLNVSTPAPANGTTVDVVIDEL